jgi:hypothetical protein
VKKKNKNEELQNIESDEEDNALEESRHDSPAGGGEDEVNPKEEGEDGDKKGKGEVTLPKDPPTEVETSKKRKVSPQKPSSIKKTSANKPQLKNVLTVDDVNLISCGGFLRGYLVETWSKKETLYERIKKDMKEIQQAI